MVISKTLQTVFCLLNSCGLAYEQDWPSIYASGATSYGYHIYSWHREMSLLKLVLRSVRCRRLNLAIWIASVKFSDDVLLSLHLDWLSGNFRSNSAEEIPLAWMDASPLFWQLWTLNYCQPNSGRSSCDPWKIRIPIFHIGPRVPLIGACTMVCDFSSVATLECSLLWSPSSAFMNSTEAVGWLVAWNSFLRRCDGTVSGNWSNNFRRLLLFNVEIFSSRFLVNSSIGPKMLPYGTFRHLHSFLRR